MADTYFSDEMLSEGFQEAVSKNEVVFRIIDKLKYDNYCECVIEDGILYLQVSRVHRVLGRPQQC